ncbi:hypothetical protein FOA43_003921 [Brettanomyces nanus]|uniref:Uncharacterized protein n=1 Tax=Eeniella nana TaxID=13502 RepID=A0A875S9N0_EENNA|nr:uncharacterized protein FOA43_003921 [Brettanomyces nanus]QPG76532.1 hypothetical protein FOA43_003921 [Brettanomyces nanus]
MFTGLPRLAKVYLPKAGISSRRALWKETTYYSRCTVSFGRMLATTGPIPDQKMNGFLKRLQQNPEIIVQLKKINQLMVSKNLVPKPEEMVDQNVRDAVSELGKSMAKSGLELTADDVKMLTQFMQENTYNDIGGKKDDDEGKKD